MLGEPPRVVLRDDPTKCENHKPGMVSSPAWGEASRADRHAQPDEGGPAGKAIIAGRSRSMVANCLPPCFLRRGESVA